MKKLILLIGLSLTLVGCSPIADNVVNDHNGNISSLNRFQNTGNTYVIDGCSWIEVLDATTGNLYLTRSGGSSPSGLSPLYDKDGKIMNINNK